MFRALAWSGLTLVGSDLFSASHALAAPAVQSVIVAVETERGEPLPSEWPSTLRRAVAARRDRKVLDSKALAELLRREGRRGRRANAAAALLRQDADAVLEAAAFGHDSEAISRGQLLLAKYRPEIEALGASDDGARAIGDTCLFVVRALLHQSNAEGARVQARECARLVPDLVMSADLHPPEVQALFASVRYEAPLGRLSAHAETHKTVECLLRLQGRPVAKLPATLELIPGTYVVQTECEHVGFSRDVQIEPNAQRDLDAAPDLEAVVRVDAAGLRYPNAPPVATDRRASLALLLRWVHADELWTVERRGEAADIRRLARKDDELVKVGERLVTAAPASTFESRVQAAVAAIVGSNGSPEKRQGDISEPSQTWRTIAGIGAISGTILIAGSWVAFARTSNLDTELDTMTYADPAYADVLQSRDTFRTLALTSTAAGGALVAGTAFVWLPRRQATPWWALVAGAGGAVAAGFGTVLWLKNGELETARCPSGEACLRPASTVPLGPMLVTQGLTLLSLPTTYVLRGFGAAPAGIDVRASSSAVSITVGGAL